MPSAGPTSSAVYNGATGSPLNVENNASRSGKREKRSRNQRSASVIARGSTAIAAESRAGLRENRRVPTPRDAEIREAYAYVNPVAALEPGTRRGIDEVASVLRSIHEQIDFDQIEVRDIREGPGCEGVGAAGLG
jgi:hypothetical protein